MTQITGQIYQMTNGKTGAALVNRFPRTVMEAVLGLNSYLQNQFSALADIYMPIEGIHESKLSQEFIYRVTPNTIKANTLTLDRIKGKTLVWNQLAQMPESGDNHGWVFQSTPVFNQDGSFTITPASDYSGGSYENISPIIGHKYYIRFGVQSNDYIRVYFSGSYLITTDYPTKTDIARIVASSDDSKLYLWGTNGVAATFWDFNIIDLTLMFGPGNEPSTVAEFEALYPGYHSYEPGKLISNDAESIETVGFNQWDEEWELGSINPGNGEPVSASDRIRSKNFCPIISGANICFRMPVANAVLYEYDADYNLIDYWGSIAPTRVLPFGSKTAYFKISMGPDYGTTYNHDICINLSDASKNGTYEPYRKSTVQLNLGSFQVRDGQGNVTTITGGLKSAGDARDEIVGNKYIKRIGKVDLGTLDWSLGQYGNFNRFACSFTLGKQGQSLVRAANAITPKYIADKYVTDGDTLASDKTFNLVYDSIFVLDNAYTDATTFQAAMSGVMLYYELATPIEYTLVSPLVPTVKAGTTEARISPNADGLSAPMVADMTYDAQANNDSASAQYALTAGRLLNTHKLWGRDFDGTQDVAGALTGVTSITMNGALSGVTTLGVSGAATLGSTLSVAGNTTLSGTLGVSGLASLAGGLKLTTTKKIWFDDTHYIELLNGELHTNLPIVSDSYITAGAAND